MRISRPVLHEHAPIYKEDEMDELDGTHSGLSDALLIPNSVGDFYLGEPANFMVTVQVRIHFSFMRWAEQNFTWPNKRKFYEYIWILISFNLNKVRSEVLVVLHFHMVENFPKFSK